MRIIYYSLLIFLLESDACHQDFRQIVMTEVHVAACSHSFCSIYLPGPDKGHKQKCVGPVNKLFGWGFDLSRLFFFFVHAPVKVVPGTPPPQSMQNVWPCQRYLRDCMYAYRISVSYELLISKLHHL